MDIREALGGAAGYSHSEGKQQEAQQHLWSIARSVPRIPHWSSHPSQRQRPEPSGRALDCPARPGHDNDCDRWVVPGLPLYQRY